MLKNNQVTIERDSHGIPHIKAVGEKEMYWGQGWVHAVERGMQMTLMRILGRGRAAELLDAGDAVVAVDTFFRRMNWTGNTQAQLDALSPATLANLHTYCDGINAGFAEKFPWEFKLLGVKPEPWQAPDIVMMARLIGYLTLAQSQAEIERLLMEMIQADVAPEKLAELFPGIASELDIPLLKKVRLNERIVQPQDLWNRGLPRMAASNNWVVSGKKTASGKPILVNDPHLEVNRLPNVWMEIVMEGPENYLMGASMPGVPGTPVGRNKQVTWGATYAFVDACDSWVERCREGNYFRQSDGTESDNNDGTWLPFRKREEIIKRKKKEPLTVTFYENEHGVLDGDPNEEGYYLATRWAPGESGAAAITAMMRMYQVENVDQAMDTMGRVESAWDLVFADTNGDIGFQMSGMAPKRRDGFSGLVPVPGWLKENDWQGFHTVEDMPRCKNPQSGFFSTANNDLNSFGRCSPINMPMGSYRADRINHLLENSENMTPEDMYRMHSDLYSRQAEMFMEILKPLLPDSQQGRILAQWDLLYDAQSEGAYLFEQFYKGLYRDVFGKKGFGEEVVDVLLNGESIYIDFYQNVDRILLSHSSAWFGEETREQLFARVAQETLSIEIKQWGAVQQVTMSHLIFGGKLPRFLGFDRGPITGIGGRATIHQGQIYKSAGRVTTFMPGYRFVAPMDQERIYTNMAGGPSDRRFSKWYCSGLKDWLNYKYKPIEP